MNFREERFAQGLLEGRTQKDAAIYAGYSPVSAEKLASEKVRSVSFREKLLARAHERGIGADFALDNVLALMKHNQTLLAGKDKDIQVQAPDGSTRVKATEILMKALGAFPDPRLELNANVSATVIVRAGDMLAPDPFADGPAIDGEAREIQGDG